MKKNRDKKKWSIKNRIALKAGSYSFVISVVVLAILVAVNVFASVMPTTATKYDMSSTKLYSITSNTKVVVNALEKDVTIYWIVQSGKENSVIENLLAKYESLSDHIEVVKKDPDVYPTFAEKYTSEDVANNSIVVECGDVNRYIPYSDIYVTQTNMATYSSETSFDGEGAITSAIDYVVSDEHPQLYILQGHGESDLPETFSDHIKKENMETNTFSLLNEDSVPEDADVVLIYAPTSDISEDEKDILSDYTKNGGKLMMVAGPVESGSLTNLYSLLEEYNIETQEGVVIEGDRDHYAFQAPYMLMPDMSSNAITDPLIDEKYYVLMPVAQGMKVNDTSGAVTTLLSTSDEAYNKADGYNITTYDKEDGDTDGPFALGVSVACDGGGQIIWFSSGTFLEEMYNSYSSGANLNLAMNALSELVGESDAVSIRSKSLSYNYLTINESTASMLKTVMIGILPIAFICAGIYVIIRRRRRQNEAV